MKRNFWGWISALVLMSVVVTACAGTATQAPLETVSPQTEAAATESAPMTEAPVMTEEATMAATEAVVETVAATEAAETVAPTEAPVDATMITLPEVDPAAVSGEIIAAGSSTVFPLAEAMAERFKEEGFVGNLTIDSIGSGAGFERFCKNGETDIATASRPIKDEEVQNCAAINRTPVEFRVGTDTLAIAVSSENDFLTDVTLEELAKIYSKDVTLWSEVNPAWPAEKIQRFSPGTDSGTFDYFIEAVMTPAYEKDAEKGKDALLNADSLQLSEDDNVLVQGVEGSPYAIGYFGYAYFQENASHLKAVAVEGVTPSAETAEDGSYKLSRPLFLYSDATIMKEKPQVAAFINFFLTYVNEEIETVGYFPSSVESMNSSAQAFLDSMK